jgi:hypothetical protein
LSSRCNARASFSSSALHDGKPTVLMLAYIVSATVLFMCMGHADPSTRMLTSVSVIMAAAFDILFPISHISLMCS